MKMFDVSKVLSRFIPAEMIDNADKAGVPDEAHREYPLRFFSLVH